jgi:hypothetical protein
MGFQNRINNQLGNSIICKSVTLSSNDILNAFTTTAPIIGAPGAGNVISVLNAELILKFNSVAYTGGGIPRLNYTGNILVVASWSTATITAAASTQQGVTGVVGDLSAAENLAVHFYNITGAFATGNSTARIDVTYQILRVG